MDKKNKIKKLLARLDEISKNSLGKVQTEADKLIEDEVSGMRKQLSDNASVKALGKIEEIFKQLKADFDLTDIQEEIKNLTDDLNTQQKIQSDSFDEKLTSFYNELKKSKDEGKKFTSAYVTDLQKKLDRLVGEVGVKGNESTSKEKTFKKEIESINSKLNDFINKLDKNITKVEAIKPYTAKKDTEHQKAIDELKNETRNLRSDLLSRLQTVGGGAINRQILVGGTNPLTKYTDYNIIAGSGITITTANDDTNKRVNLTFTSSASGAFETPVGTVDDSNTTFTVSNTPLYIIVNGAQYIEGTGLFSSYSGGTITLSAPVGTGGFIRSAS